MANQSISAYHSNKLRATSFWMIVLVFYIHSYNKEAEQFGIASWIQSVCDYGLGSIAVPMFFCISGYLFFNSINGIRDVLQNRSDEYALCCCHMLCGILLSFWVIMF